MRRKPPPEGALFVRLPTDAVEKLHRAAEELGMHKKDIVAGLVSRYLDSAQAAVPAPRMAIGFSDPPRGSYAFKPHDVPEVMSAEQAAQFLQIEPATVIDLAEVGKLPGRRLGGAWRFSRTGLVEWLSRPETEKR